MRQVIANSRLQTRTVQSTERFWRTIWSKQKQRISRDQRESNQEWRIVWRHLGFERKNGKMSTEVGLFQAFAQPRLKLFFFLFVSSSLSGYWFLLQLGLMICTEFVFRLVTFIKTTSVAAVLRYIMKWNHLLRGFVIVARASHKLSSIGHGRGRVQIIGQWNVFVFLF